LMTRSAVCPATSPGMPVSDWAKIFSGPLFRRRLEPDYLAKSDQYFVGYQSSLREFGKQSPFWQ